MTSDLSCVPPARSLPVPKRPAVLLAGDRRHSRAVVGQSKAFVAVGEKPMVVHVLEALLSSPRVGDVVVVGDPSRLEACFREHSVADTAAAASRAVRIVPQGDTLYYNVWNGFLRSLPAGSEDPEHAVLVVPADVPLLVTEEVSEFIERAEALDADYVLGLTPGVSLERFEPQAGLPGIEMACFNLREGRFRQNNLHWVRPLRMGNRHYVEDMYASRHQKELLEMLVLGCKVLRREFRLLWVLYPFLVLHLGGVLDRRGWARASRAVRRFVSFATVESAASALLRTRFAIAVTTHGGAALDVDNDGDREVADKMFSAWKQLQLELSPPAML